MRKFLYVLSLLSLMILSLPANGANVIINAKLDTTVMLMGKQTTLKIQTVQDKNVVGHLVNETDSMIGSNVEIRARLKPDTTELGNGRIQIDRSLIIQSFDSGMWVIPAAQYVVGKDTFKSKELFLKIVPVPVDSLTTINDFKNVEEPEFKFFDWMPDFITDNWVWILVVLLIIAGAVGSYIIFKKKPKLPFMPTKKEIPPYEQAIEGLKHLKEEKLWQSGNEKEYYTRLTDILRTYIDRRFQINAMEMTSSQIVAVLKKNDETKAVNEQLAQILEVADFVKFAKERPLPDDNELAYTRAVRFVEETKPVEIINTESTTDDKSVAELNNKKEN